MANSLLLVNLSARTIAGDHHQWACLLLVITHLRDLDRDLALANVEERDTTQLTIHLDLLLAMVTVVEWSLRAGVTIGGVKDLVGRALLAGFKFIFGTKEAERRRKRRRRL